MIATVPEDPPRAYELDFPTYKEERNRNVETLSRQAKFIDQTVLALAGGGLGLTLTFLHDLVITPPKWTPLLFLGSGLLILSIIFVLWSLHSSQAAIGLLISQMDEAAKEAHDSVEMIFTDEKFVNSHAKLTSRLNTWASGFVVAGIAAISIFAYVNLLTSPEDMKMKKIELNRPAPTELKKGIVPQKPAVTQLKPNQTTPAPSQPTNQTPATKK